MVDRISLRFALSIFSKIIIFLDFYVVYIKIIAMGKRLIDSEKEEIRKLYNETDYTMEEVAKVFNVSSKTVFRVLHFLCNTSYPERHTREQIRKKYEKNHPNRYKDYYQAHKKEINKRTTERNKRKRAENPQYRLKCNLRSRLSKAIKNQNTNKSANTEKLIGCSIEELKHYIENKFTEGMTWENYGKWHIDHIIPCSSFDLTIKEEQYKCFHYTNLQPLWASDNLKKGNKIIVENKTL